MARSDPTETGGLFTGRKSSSSIRFRSAGEGSNARRRRADRALANVLLTIEALLCISLLGPQPIAWLWLGAHVQYWTDAITAAIGVVLLGCLTSLLVTMAIAIRVDHWWKLVRRAAGYHQEGGALELMFAVCVGVVTIFFTFWFFIIEGPGPSLAPHG